MGSYIGGSAPAMARQICDGFTLVSPPLLKRLEVAQLEQLQFELDKRLRETRAEPMDLEDQQALQVRNRRISRIESAVRVIAHAMSLMRRRRV